MIHQFIKKMVAKHNFNKTELEKIFDKVVLDKISLTKEAKTYHKTPRWSDYRHRFLTKKRIEKGVLYWKRNAKTLSRAEKKYGIPASIIVAILGIETFYGKNMGNHKALDALTTLSFKYPQRSDYFLGELESFLLLTRQSNTDPNTILGSFDAGLGQAQFMPSSYLAYAVDFSGDGYADLFTNDQDVIGSIANYLKQYGWQRDQPIVARATVTGNQYQKIAMKEMDKLHDPTMTLKQLAKLGIMPIHNNYPKKMLATFMIQQGHKGDEYWLGFHNFYVISRYNNRAMYVLAAYELGQAIKAQYRKSLTHKNKPKKP